VRLETLPLTDGRRMAWNAVCERSREAWFWHTTQWLDYTVAYDPSLRSQSRSFLVYQGETAMAAVPWFWNTGIATPASAEFSFGGSWTPSPAIVEGLTEQQRQQVLRKAFERIMEIAQQTGVGRIRFRSNPFSALAGDASSVLPPTAAEDSPFRFFRLRSWMFKMGPMP